MLDKTKRYLIVGLGLLGGKYALELSKAGFHVDGINRSEGHLQYALDHGYIETGKTHDFEDLVSQADHIIFGLYPTALIDWFKTYGHLIKPGCIFTDVSGVKTGLVEPVQAMCPEGVEFIASHPMAGRETSSVEHAAEVSFAPANFIITPTEKNTPEAVQWAKELAEVLGFRHICTLTVQEHDKIYRLRQPALPRHRRQPHVCKRQLFSLRVHGRLLPRFDPHRPHQREDVGGAVPLEQGEPHRRDRPVRFRSGPAAGRPRGR